jgi:hypothetical protein
MYPKASLARINIHSQTLTPEFSFEKGDLEAGKVEEQGASPILERYPERPPCGQFQFGT